MKTYMLDTNICIYILNKASANLIKKLTSKDPAQISISSIVYSELLYGISKSNKKEKNKSALDCLLKDIGIKPYDAKSGVVFGDIRSRMEKTGNIIGPYDMLIAAHAMASGSVLVTHNTRDFERVPGLYIEDWFYE